MTGDRSPRTAGDNGVGDDGLTEREKSQLHEEDRALFSRDTRGIPRKPVAGRCAAHLDRQAMAVCTECGRLLCGECIFASGGGHAFCRECMNSSRLVDAEPRIMGSFVEATENPPSARTAVLAVILVMAILSALAAVLVGWALVSRGGAG